MSSIPGKDISPVFGVVILMLRKINHNLTLFFTILSLIFLFTGCGPSLVQLVKDNKIEAVKSKLKNGSDLDKIDKKTGKSPLIMAITNQSISMIELLIENGADLDYDSWEDRTPLSYAIETGNIEIVALLLKNGANLHLIYTYRTYRHTEVPSPNKYITSWKQVYGTSLIDAIYRQVDIKIVELLLEYGSSVNTQDSFKKTPLAFAIEKENTDLVRFLLEEGANPNFQYDYLVAKHPTGFETAPIYIYSPRTPLTVAKEINNEEIIRLLIDAGALTELPVITKGVNAIYPESHKPDSSFSEGKVGVKVLVNTEGNVEEVKVTYSSHSFLNDAAIEAAWQFKFKPGRVDDKPMKSWMGIVFTFTPPQN